MTRPRVIPVMLLADGGLVKTVRFKRPHYLGDPINAVRIFNDKRVDELILLDIEATSKRRVDYAWIEAIVSEAFMPVAYGGGIRSIEQCDQLFRLGIEKLVFNTAVIERPEVIRAAAARFGSQSIVAAIDVRRDLWTRPRAYIRNGGTSSGLPPIALAKRCEAMGVGELMVTSVAREGTFEGYELELLKSIADAVSVPVIANGGAGHVRHLGDAIRHAGCSAAAAGSLFVFAGKGEGVLITYPSEHEIQEYCSTSHGRAELVT